MRQIELAEADLIRFLAQVGDIELAPLDRQLVWVINQEMGSIRADYCPKECRVHSVASYEFFDCDGVPIVATLLLTIDGRFGELDFWKVNDEPVICQPTVRPSRPGGLIPS